MFSATITARAPETVIELEGDLDIAAAPHLVGVVQGALNAGCDRITLDLARLAFADPKGLSGIASTSRLAAELGVELVVVNARPLTSMVLDMTELRSVVDVRSA